MPKAEPGTQAEIKQHESLAPNSRILLLVNPAAGRNKWLRSRQISRARQELECSGMSVEIQEVGSEAREGAELAREAVAQGIDLILVCGGDGTINHVIQGLVPSHVPLAILPGGTANMLARELGIPLSIVKAARAIPTSIRRRISVGSAGGRFFVSLAGIGFDARVVRKLDKRWKAALGIGSYVMEAFRQLFFESPSPFFSLSANGIRQQVTYACVSKSQHFGHVRVLPEADLFSNEFYLYAFLSQSRWRYVQYGGAILAGRKRSLPDFLQLPTQQIDCESIHPEECEIYFQVDGELAGCLPCSIEIVSDALTLMVPAHRTNGGLLSGTNCLYKGKTE
jgi:YegS/Rv2252/BmrU family lipid kinase